MGRGLSIDLIAKSQRTNSEAKVSTLFWKLGPKSSTRVWKLGVKKRFNTSDTLEMRQGARGREKERDGHASNHARKSDAFRWTLLKCLCSHCSFRYLTGKNY